MLKKQYSKTKPICKVTFTLAQEAIEGAKGVKVLGDFNNWNPALGIPMKLSGSEFKTVIELPIGRDYQFRYLADNGVWENDWAADDYIEAPFDVCNSVVALTAKETTKTSPSKANAKTDTKAKTSATGKVGSASATKSKPDNLKKIEGIGPKIAQLLINDGITTFEALSKTTKTTLIGILEKAGSRYKMHDPSSWAKQAKVAAKGDWAKLKKFQDELVGGRKK